MWTPPFELTSFSSALVAFCVVASFMLDQVFGELPSRFHPVVGMGALTQFLSERLPRRPKGTAFLAGALVAVLVPTIAAAAVGLLWRLLEALGLEWARWGLEPLLLTTTFAVRALGDAVHRVRERLLDGDVDNARDALRSLCSRDASRLDEAELSAAAIESAAENLSDSFVAPMLYYLLFGLPGAFAYRAINTLDAMLGYRGELEYFGKASARLDDLANLVPARITAFLLWLVAPRGRTRGLRVWAQDASATASPNAGHPMAMMAGLLGVELRKAGAYTLGGGQRPPTPSDIAWSIRLVMRASWLTLGLSTAAALFGGFSR